VLCWDRHLTFDYFLSMYWIEFPVPNSMSELVVKDCVWIYGLLDLYGRNEVVTRKVASSCWLERVPSICFSFCLSSFFLFVIRWIYKSLKGIQEKSTDILKYIHTPTERHTQWQDWTSSDNEECLEFAWKIYLWSEIINFFLQLFFILSKLFSFFLIIKPTPNSIKIKNLDWTKTKER
jgi:hypothetical protein